MFAQQTSPESEDLNHRRADLLLGFGSWTRVATLIMKGQLISLFRDVGLDSVIHRKVRAGSVEKQKKKP